MKKSFKTKSEAEAFHSSIHPLIGAKLSHKKPVAEKTETREDVDTSHDPIAALEAAIERGDDLAARALEFFRGTTWGSQKRDFANALNCIWMDVAEGCYWPALSRTQAEKFLTRLEAAVKWVTVTDVTSAIPESWVVDFNSDIGLDERAEKFFVLKEAEAFLAKCGDPTAKIVNKGKNQYGCYVYLIEFKSPYSISKRERDSQADPTDSISGFGNAYGD